MPWRYGEYSATLSQPVILPRLFFKAVEIEWVFHDV